MTIAPHLALHRFGFGVRAGAAHPADAMDWLDQQTVPGAPEFLGDLPGELPLTLWQGLSLWRQVEANPPPPGQEHDLNRLFRREQEAWARHLLLSGTGFHDRLVSLWLNHFTVSHRAGLGVRSGYPQLLREAVRPHATGRFVDLLLAAAKAPSMLFYMDHANSIGPNSREGRRTGRGLNENLAREILELHTVTPAAGYSQADVTEFAKLLSGWGVDRSREPGGTVFRATHHEPGPKTIMGRTFDEGPEALDAALRWLGTHPATYRNVAFRLVQHFLADAPRPASVARIEAVLAQTGGDLGAAARSLVRLPEAATLPLGKLRSPMEYLTALFRAGGGTDPRPVLGFASALGQPLWNAAQPNGWPELSQAWAAPASVVQRLDLAFEAAGRFASRDPLRLLEGTLGPLARGATRRAVANAGSARDAVTLLFVSAEMQYR